MNIHRTWKLQDMLHISKKQTMENVLFVYQYRCMIGLVRHDVATIRLGHHKKVTETACGMAWNFCSGYTCSSIAQIIHGDGILYPDDATKCTFPLSVTEVREYKNSHVKNNSDIPEGPFSPGPVWANMSPFSLQAPTSQRPSWRPCKKLATPPWWQVKTICFLVKSSTISLKGSHFGVTADFLSWMLFFLFLAWCWAPLSRGFYDFVGSVDCLLLASVVGPATRTTATTATTTTTKTARQQDKANKNNEARAHCM